MTTPVPTPSAPFSSWTPDYSRNSTDQLVERFKEILAGPDAFEFVPLQESLALGMELQSRGVDPMGLL